MAALEEAGQHLFERVVCLSLYLYHLLYLSLSYQPRAWPTVLSNLDSSQACPKLLVAISSRIRSF